MAVASQAALLDELMGKARNADLGVRAKSPNWDDEDNCPYYLVGFCPNTLFPNTKSDLGPCPKVHDDRMVEKYKASRRYGKMGYEEDLLQRVNHMLVDVDRKINRGRNRLKLNGPTMTTTVNENRKIQLQTLNKKIDDILANAEEEGCQGNIDESQKLISDSEKLKAQKASLEKDIEASSQMEKELEVCDVCGAFRIKDDAPSRIEEHLQGKMHIGYSKIREFISSYEEEKKKRDEIIRQRNEQGRRHSSKDRGEKAKKSSSHRSDDQTSFNETQSNTFINVLSFC